MQLISLRLNRFKSFVEPTAFKFPPGPGLFFLRGENRDEPRLDANGAGKSTIWDALTWLFFERTVRGLRAGEVCSWGLTGGTEVALDFEHEGGFFTITRTWKPNSWILFDHYEGITDTNWSPKTDLAKDPGNPVLAALQMTYTTWLNAVVMAAAEPMFLDLKPEAKASLFSSILNLDQWLDLSAAASKRAAEQDKITRRLESEVSRLTGVLEGLKDAGDEQLAAEWDRRHKEDTEDLVGRYEEADVSEHHARRAMEKAEQRVKSLGDEYDVAKKKHRAASDKLAEARVEMRQLAVIEQDKCPTCGQKVHADAEARAMLKQARDLERQVVGALDSLDKQLAALDQDLRQAEREYSDARARLNEIDRVLDRLAGEADQLQKATNPYKEAVTRRAEQRLRMADDLEAALDELEESESKQARYSYWVTGFKDIRLTQLAEGLQQLEIEVNSRCVELGLVGWALRFSVDKETKKGTISRGFTVMVESPSNEGPVPWEAWSGGETQRLRLAGQMGLADMARARLGIPRDLPEIWDEPTAGLSDQGVKDLLDCLASRAIAEGRQIWVVDHHSLGYGAFDGVVTVVKTEKGSRLETA